MKGDLDLNKVRAEIAGRAVRFVLLESNIHALVIKTFTGSGKTTSVLNAIDRAGMRWIYVAPFHKVIRQNVKRSPIRHFNFLHLEGRERCCLRQELKPLIENGVSIGGFCDDCNFKEGACPYFQNRRQAYREMPNLAITHAHIQTFLPNFLNHVVDDHLIRDYYDVMVIDENPISCFLHQKQLTMSEIRYIREVFTLTGMPDELIQLMDYIGREDINYDEIRRLNFSRINAIRTNTDFSSRVAELYHNGVIAEVPPNIVPILFEIMNRIGPNEIEDMIYYNERSRSYNLVYFTANALSLGLRIIGLDGTANDEVWEAMLGTDNFDTFERDHTYWNVYQLGGGRYPISTWKKNESVQNSLCELIDMIARRKKRDVLVLGTKWSNRVVSMKTKSKNVRYATFYNLRSFNDFYKHCDTLILPIEPNPPQDSIDSYVALSEWDEKLWRKIVREEEMLQGIGRIRQNIKYLTNGKDEEGNDIISVQREEIEIFIFPSTGVRKINTFNIDVTDIKDPLEKMDHKIIDKIPTLLPEATVISMKELKLYLTDKIDLSERSSIIDNILDICPTTQKEIMDKLGYGRARTRKYINYMLQRKLIETKGRNYDITERGYRKLTPEEKEKRTIG
jgi:hypothetical protein